jgi:hypothetical protein
MGRRVRQRSGCHAVARDDFRLAGPSEAWFLSGYDSYAAYEQDQDAIEANAPSGRKETSSRPLMASC